MADERIRAVGDLERNLEGVNKQYVQAEKNVASLRGEYNNFAKSQKAVLNGLVELKEKLTASGDPKTIQALKEQQEMHRTVAEQIKKEESIKRQLIDTEKKLIQKQKEEELLKQRKLRTAAQLEAAKKREAAAQAKTVKASIAAKKAIIQENSAYAKLSRQRTNAQNRLQRYIATYGKFDERTKRVRRNFERLNRQFERNNVLAKKGAPFVGIYNRAYKGLSSTIAKLGVTFGVAQIFRGVTGTIVDFDDAVANLGATSGKTEQELKPLIAQSKELGSTTQFTATEVSNLQLELAKLGFSTDEILASTGALSNFAAATGADLPAAAKLGGSALRAFGLEASEMERVVSTLGVATTKSALDFQFLETGLSTVAPVAKSFGFSIEDTTALLGQLANSGFDASSAATATRNILLNLADSGGALAKKLGQPVKNSEELASALQQLKSEGVDLAEVLELTDKRSVAAFNTFIEGSDTLVNLKDSITDQNKALEEMAKKRLNSVSGQWKLLTSAIQGYILGSDDANGISEKLKNTLGFLAENIGTIFNVMGRLLTFFGIYKARMIVLNALNGKFGASLKSIAEAFKKGETNGKRFSGGLKSIGSALKNIGWTAAIAGAVKLAQAFWDVASGARQARQDAQLLDAVVGKVNQRVQEGLDARQKELDQKLELAKTEEERKKLREDFIAQNELEAKGIAKLLEQEKAKLEIAKRFQKQQSGLLEIQAESTDQFLEFFGGDLRDINDIVGEHEAKVAALESGYKTLSVSTVDAKHSLEVFNKEQLENLDNLRDANEELKERESLMREIEDAENELIENDLERAKQRLDIEVARAAEEIDKSTAVEEEKAQLKMLVFEKYLRDLNKLQRDFEAQQLEDAKALLDGFDLPTLSTPEAEDFGLGIEEDYTERRLQLLLDSKKSSEQIEEELSDYRIELLEREIRKRKDLQLDATQFEIELAELRRREEEEERKEWLDAGKQALSNLEAAASKNADAIIKEQDRLIDSEQKLLESLEKRAEFGLNDGESIKRRQQAVREAQQEKIRLEKEKQAIEFATAAITTFTSALEQGKSVPEAFGDVALSQAGLELILNQFPKFMGGTKWRLGDENKPVHGGKDGHLIWADSSEPIIRGELADKAEKAGIRSTDHLVNSAVKMMELENSNTALNGISPDAYTQMLFMPNIPTPIYDDDRMLKRLDSIAQETKENTRAIKNLKFPYTELGEIMKNAFEILDHDGQGNTVRTLMRLRQKHRRNG